MFRLARKIDLLPLFELANDNVVRQNAFNSSKIAFEEHKKWFNAKLSNKNCKYYVYTDNRTNKLISAIHLDFENNAWTISIDVSKEFRSMGLGKKFLKWVILKNKNKKFIAYVKIQNTASIALFASFGFKRSKDIEIKNQICACFSLN